MKSMTTDPIADLLTRLRNAEMASHDSCEIPYSKMKESILNILKKHLYIEDFEVSGEGVDKKIDVKLKTDKARTSYRRMSKPGQRIYVSVNKIRPVQNGLGIAILSTSKGVLDNIDAKKEKVGGELLCEVW